MPQVPPWFLSPPFPQFRILGPAVPVPKTVLKPPKSPAANTNRSTPPRDARSHTKTSTYPGLIFTHYFITPSCSLSFMLPFLPPAWMMRARCPSKIYISHQRARLHALRFFFSRHTKKNTAVGSPLLRRAEHNCGLFSISRDRSASANPDPACLKL